MAAEWLPVAPVQHYFMGGVSTDIDGRTSSPGLWAVGEASCTGIYGANRLASNSLLECLVFGRRIARAIHATPYEKPVGLYAVAGTSELAQGRHELPPERIQTIRRQIRQLMERYCGILRNQEGLQLAEEQLAVLERETDGIFIHDRTSLEACQMIRTALAIVKAALRRKNSIGAHFRTDDPAASLSNAI
jgi:L-aspartate oxidase